jgi:hypothetical protein
VALNMGQWGVPTGTIATITIPPGPYNITVYNANTAANTTLWMAMGTSPTVAPNLTTTNGMVMHSIPTSWSGYQGSRGGVLWALNTTSSSTVPYNYVLVTQET